VPESALAAPDEALRGARIGGWTKVPAWLRSASWLRQHGLRPGERFAEVWQRADERWVPLYAVAEARPRKPPSDRQAGALAVAAAVRERREDRRWATWDR
jgi:hypothetical protein